MRRARMTTDGINQPFRLLGTGLYGHPPHNPPTSRHSIPCPLNSTTGTLYFVGDGETKFNCVLQEKITLPKPVSWAASCEGVQLLVSEDLRKKLLL